jgi:hypothetical protein
MAGKKSEEKEDKPNYLGILGTLFEALIDHANGEIRKIKAKILNFIIVVFFLILSLMFILIGIAKSLPLIFDISEGVSFIIMGCLLIVILAFYYVIKQI